MVLYSYANPLKEKSRWNPGFKTVYLFIFILCFEILIIALYSIHISFSIQSNFFHFFTRYISFSSIYEYCAFLPVFDN